MKTYTCPWCEASGPASEFDMSPDGKGFWCPDCDGYFYKKPEDDNRRMLLLLEKRYPSPTQAPAPSTPLRKRLSPLRYPGGKSKVIDQIYGYLDKSKLDTFVEMFAGGASLGLSLLQAKKINKLVLNDYDPMVFNFWKCVVDNPQPIISRIQDTLVVQDYYQAQEELDDAVRVLRSQQKTQGLSCLPNPAILGQNTCFDLAYKFLLVNRLSFGGIQMAGPICGKNGTTKELLQRWNPKMLKKRIEDIAQMAHQITVTFCDAAQLLEEHVGWLPSNSTLFVAPPYYKAGPSLYKEGFSEKHEELADLLTTFYVSYPGPDIIITYDDCPAIREMYPYAAIEQLITHWSISRN